MKISSRWSWIMPKTLHFEICWTWWEPCFIKAFILQCDTEDIQEVLRDHLSALYFFPYEHFPITCAHFSITLSHPNIQGHPERMRKVKRSPWTLNLGPMKTVLLFFFLDDDDPVLQVGLELRDYESESGRKQSFSYDVSWTQLWSDIALWCVQTSQTMPLPADLIYLYFFKNIFWEEILGEIQLSEASSTQYVLQSIYSSLLSSDTQRGKGRGEYSILVLSALTSFNTGRIMKHNIQMRRFFDFSNFFRIFAQSKSTVWFCFMSKHLNFWAETQTFKNFEKRYIL